MPPAKIVPRPRFPWWPAAALIALTVLLYIPSMMNGFIWDDPQYVVDNPTLKSADGLLQIWINPWSTPQFYPMVHTTFWIEAQLAGTQNATLYHIDNILLHAMAAVLLWRVLLSIDVIGAWLAAAIFAVHPVMVESVTWITERKNVLSIVFYLLAFLAYRRTILLGSHDSTSVRELVRLPQPNHWYWISLALFLLALLSKTVTCSLPAAILLVIWWKRGNIFWTDIKPLLPMFAIGLALSAFTGHLEQTHVGARGPDFQWSMLDRCLIAGHAICFYAGKLLRPTPLIFMYPHWDLHLPGSLKYAYPVGVIAVVGALFAARRWIGRGPLTAALFFIGTLVPALGFVNVYPMRYSFVADHFQYLASIGIIALVASALWRIRFVSFSILLPLAWITWHQQQIYKDRFTLWTNTIAQNPTCWMAHLNLAGVYRDKKDYDAALAEDLCGLKLAPGEADAHYDAGRALAEHSRWPEAIDQFRTAIACDAQCAPAWSDLAKLLWDHDGSPAAQAQAFSAAQTALAIQPNLADAHYVLARVAELSGNTPAAITEYGKALSINDEDFQSHFNLGNCLLQSGHPGEAAGEYEKVLKHDPRNTGALTNEGFAWLAAGKLGDAKSRFKSALAIDPNLARAKDGLAQVTSGSRR